MGLLVTAASALGTLFYLRVSVSIHAVVGIVFVGLVAVHLVQRRKTVKRLASQLLRVRSLAVSDALLAFITLVVLVSGLVDWLDKGGGRGVGPKTVHVRPGMTEQFTGGGVPLQIPLPPPFNTLHRLSSLVLVVYVVLHVWHRRKRLRKSVIR